MLTLIEGPGGAGKSEIAEDALASGEADVLADLTLLWAAVRALRRGPDGRFPVRPDSDPGLALAAYLRTTAVRQGLQQGRNVIVTTGTPDTALGWQRLAEDAGVPFNVRTIDPGRAVVERRLSIGGVVSDDCGRVIRRWYGA